MALYCSLIDLPEAVNLADGGEAFVLVHIGNIDGIAGNGDLIRKLLTFLEFLDQDLIPSSEESAVGVNL